MFCKNCGKELADNSKFCQHCGAEQGSKEAESGIKKFIVPIMVIAIAVAIIAVAAVVLIKNDNSDSDGERDNNKYSYEEDTGANNRDKEGTQDISSKPLAEVNYKEIKDTKISLDGEDSSNSYAAYSYLETDGNTFMILCPYSDGYFILTAVVPKNMCESGMSFSNEDMKDNTYFDLCVIQNDNAVEYTSIKNPTVFSDMYFELGQYTQDVEAGFILNGEFIYEGSTYKLEASAVADYMENPYDNQYSTTGDAQDEICNYCYGSKNCFLCHGLGYTTWGGTRVDCSSCGGRGYCYYCGGTGKMVY